MDINLDPAIAKAIVIFRLTLEYTSSMFDLSRRKIEGGLNDIEQRAEYTNILDKVDIRSLMTSRRNGSLNL